LLSNTTQRLKPHSRSDPSLVVLAESKRSQVYQEAPVAALTTWGSGVVHPYIHRLKRFRHSQRTGRRSLFLHFLISSVRRGMQQRRFAARRATKGAG